MGRLINGVNGQIQGKVGNLIGSSRNGIPYVKGPYKNRTKTISKKELLNRKKFAMAQAWLSPLLNFLREGFRGYSERSEGFIAAKSWLLKNSFTGAGENLQIDPALVKVSSGNLPNPKNVAVELTESGNLKFTWNPGEDVSFHADQVMMVAYDVENAIAFSITTGQFRSAGSDLLQVGRMNNKSFHVYAAFNAADRSRQSDSIYLGEWKFPQSDSSAIPS
ncbi:MAG TPA: DUF6266 family protein [Puia sp.]|nr:DUF6266 family protein [Puia sp.]